MNYELANIELPSLAFMPVRAALKLAKRSVYKYQLGAVILKGSRIVAQGFNKIKTHPSSTNEYRMLHAEMDVIRQLDPDELEGCTICVVRLRKTGLASSKPCEYCMSFIESTKLSKLIYIDDFGDVVIKRLR